MKIISLIISFFLVGCTGITQYKHAHSINDSTLHLYRVSDSNASAIKAIISVDDQNILKISNREYAEVPIKPGTHKISVKGHTRNRKDEIEIGVTANNDLYYKIKANPARLGPTLMIPILELLVVKTFILEQSNKTIYEQENKYFTKKKLQIANKPVHSDGSKRGL